MSAPRFPLGRLFCTPSALESLTPEGLDSVVRMHQAGDWGVISLDDMVANEHALREGDRLVSRYDVRGNSFYVITEADRSYTTVMLREEY